MKTTMKTAFAVFILLTFSCKKENTAIQSSGSGDESTTQANVTSMNEPAANAVRIGNQVWMTKNLDVTRYRNGDRIPYAANRAKWASLTTGAWCWYRNDSANGKIYGKLYNWYAVNDPRGLAPDGWHIPSDAEWTALSAYLGGEIVADGKMKETGTTHWLAPNDGATNSSGFTGLPGGARNIDGTFYNIGFNGYWWGSTEGNTLNAWVRAISFASSYVFRNENDKRNGFSVRCLRD